MPKTVAEIRAIISDPKKRNEIAKAMSVEARVRLHSEASLSEYDCSSAVTEFLSFVKSLLHDYDAHRTFLSLFRYPVDTVPLTGEAYDSLEKIFDGRDPVYRAEFLSPKFFEDWTAFREKAKMDWFWRNEAFCELKESFKSFIVVDLPELQTDMMPTPYPYFLSLTQVIDYDETPEYGGNEESVNWILFRVDETHVAYFDNVSYQIFETEKGEGEVKQEIANITHGLGYCPALKFWCEEHPFEKYLSKLDKLLFFLVSKDQMDLNNSFPVWWVYESDCDFEDPTTHDYCDGGFLRQSNGGPYIMSRALGSSAQLCACPKCGGKFRGAGTVLELPVPKGGDEKPLGTPAGIITTPVDSLTFHVAEIQRRALEFFEGVTGKGSEPTNDQAQNEKQVMSSFESRTDVLKKTKKHFERAQQWTEETMCRLRYSDRFVSLSVDYGQTFYLATAEMLLEQYQQAQLKNTPDEILDQMLADYQQTKYRNNSKQLQREKILTNLDPYRHRTLAQVQGLFDKGLIPFEEYYLKFNFSTLIGRFERENTGVTEFAEALGFDAKIQAIQSTLLGYGKTIEATRGKQEVNGGGIGNIPAPAIIG